MRQRGAKPLKQDSNWEHRPTRRSETVPCSKGKGNNMPGTEIERKKRGGGEARKQLGKND